MIVQLLVFSGLSVTSVVGGLRFLFIKRKLVKQYFLKKKYIHKVWRVLDDLLYEQKYFLLYSYYMLIYFLH
ncbi:hypothetical protein RhiirC2_42441 [Rhizophagus irregularis]|uniref:Uncharacterized protein n=1 Tax=Rhizophagus irregularis TaxID=588596 RepID=A0A2N1MX49_9GLOM|nr:hypothetical protein RhiirC2_42441 [Rhizophagus irregularis]